MLNRLLTSADFMLERSQQFLRIAADVSNNGNNLSRVPLLYSDLFEQYIRAVAYMLPNEVAVAVSFLLCYQRIPEFKFLGLVLLW